VKQSDFALGRINALSDGVFAIAMTLLVLDLKLPPLESAGDGDSVSAALVEQFPRFISWVLSFAILCRLWITHHLLSRAGDTRSRTFMTWNLLFLGAIACIPFPTSLLSEHHDQALSVFIFSATFAVAGLALAGMAVAYRKQLESAETLGDEKSVARVVTIILATAGISSLLALIHPRLGVLIWVIYPFVSVIGLHRRAFKDLPAGDRS